MGGGDLNSKKSWHPNTFKNQERVWKAEKVAADEKQRIIELQQERAQERDRQELNELARKNASNNSNNRLDWMYSKPDKPVQQEEYLLGKAIDKNFDQKGKAPQNEIPAVTRRVVGSSMLSEASDVQVDLARKVREDPLLLVKERERAARAALLNNPVQRKKLAELLRKEQEQKKVHKDKKKHKKKDKDLDKKLAAKLNALSSNKIDLAKLLESDDSSDDSSLDEEHSKKKKKSKKSKSKSKKVEKSRKKDKDKTNLKRKQETKHKDSSSDSEDNGSTEAGCKYRKKSSSYDKESVSHIKKYKKDYSCQSDEPKYKRYYDYEDNNRDHHRARKKERSDEKNISKQRYYNDTRDKRETERSTSYKKEKNYKEQMRNKKSSLSDAEKATKLAEMAAAGAEREVQRGRRVAEQLAENLAGEKVLVSRMLSRNEARALPASLESRIHSNRHNIQRSERHMSEHFARR